MVKKASWLNSFAFSQSPKNGFARTHACTQFTAASIVLHNFLHSPNPRQLYATLILNSCLPEIPRSPDHLHCSLRLLSSPVVYGQFRLKHAMPIGLRTEMRPAAQHGRRRFLLLGSSGAPCRSCQRLARVFVQPHAPPTTRCASGRGRSLHCAAEPAEASGLQTPGLPPLADAEADGACARPLPFLLPAQRRAVA